MYFSQNVLKRVPNLFSPFFGFFLTALFTSLKHFVTGFLTNEFISVGMFWNVWQNYIFMLLSIFFSSLKKFKTFLDLFTRSSGTFAQFFFRKLEVRTQRARYARECTLLRVALLPFLSISNFYLLQRRFSATLFLLLALRFYLQRQWFSWGTC